MRFRDFVEVTRDGLESVAFKLDGDRDITPMLHLESALGVSHIGIDRQFFDTAATVKLLVTRYVVPLIAENEARKVAWSYCAWVAPTGGPRPSQHPGRREMLLATFIDPEVIEHWGAPLVRPGGPVVIGPWQAAVPQLGGGRLVTTVQQALR